MFVCKICKEKYSTLEGLYSHLEEEHGSLIPPNMTTAHYYYYLKTGRKNGNCVMCKKPTKFNEKTKKYHRFCEDPICKQKYKETVDKRMIGVYGKVNLLNDPEQQRKMLMGRSISGKYNFNGVEKTYVGSYELDFLKTMDLFFNWDPNDILSPSPHTYYYEYEGQKHFYIPDFYIMSLALEIEVKDGGDNPNRHHKIQDVDKEKEKLKDKVMHTQKINHYVKLTNKNYYNLFEFFRISKEYVEKYGDYEKIPKIILDEDIKTKNISSKNELEKEVDKIITENYEPVEEKFELDKFLIWFEKPISKLKDGNIRLYHGSSIDIKEKIITPISVNVGATKLSNPRWSTYFWDNLEMAIQWAITWEVRNIANTECLYRNHDGKTILMNNTNLSNEKFIDNILKANPTIFIYETIVPIKKLEMGSTASMPEYTVSETVKIIKKTRIRVNRNMIYNYFKIVSEEEYNRIMDTVDINFMSRYRNRLVSVFLNEERDAYRYLIKRDMDLDKIQIGDNLSKYRRRINDAMSVDLLGLNENADYSYIDEGFNFGKNDMYINFNRFESGECNVCLITGLSGSGKSTLGRKIAEEYDAEYIELDNLFLLGSGLKNVNKNLIPFVKKYKKVYDDIENGNFNEYDNLPTKLLEDIISYCESIKHKKFVIEGIQIYAFGYKYIKDYPLIIINSSKTKSMLHMFKRDMKFNSFNDFIKTMKEIPKYIGDYNKYQKDLDLFKRSVTHAQQDVYESYVCFPLLNSIISSNYTDVKSKEQYKKDIDGFKRHFLQGISNIKSIDDAKAMKSDLESLTNYLHDIKYTNKYSGFKNINAVKDIENWMTNTAMPQVDEIIKKYEKQLEPVTEYNHTITFALNNNIKRGLYGLMDDVSSIIIDDKIQIKRINNIMSVSESIDINDNTTNVSFGTNEDIKLKKDNVPYLIWNKNQSIDTLLESFIKEWLIPIDINHFNIIKDGDE